MANPLQPEKSPGPSEATREDPLLAGILAGALGPHSDASRQAVLSQQVANAVATLDALKQFVVNHRFGLGGCPVLSHEAIASHLTGVLSDELRGAMAKEQAIDAGEVRITAGQVRDIETQALRDLRSPPKKA